MTFLQQQFAQDVKEKLEGTTLREAALEARVSAATLSRTSLGGACDMGTFGKICGWMQKSPNDYFSVTGESRLDVIHRVLQGYLEYKTYAEGSDLPAEREKAYRTFLNDLKGIK